MSRGYLVLDIETVPDGNLYQPQPAAAGTERPFPPLYAHRPIVIGVLWLDDDYVFKRVGVIGENKEEPQMLADFAAFMERERPTVVTFNGRGFDLPVIALRCLSHGVPLRFYYGDKDFRYRFSETGHLDLFDALTDHGAVRSLGGLDPLARLIGLPGKVGVDGSQVEGLYNAGQIEAIRNYCLSDVVQTAFLLLRFRVLQGQMPLDRYRTIARALITALEGEVRLVPFLEKVDRPRLLLEA